MQFIMEALGLNLSQIYELLAKDLPPKQEAELDLAEWAARLGIPLSRVFNRRFFYDSLFNISPFVLDPRPETEALVEYIIGLKPSSVLDLGTGSGCILLSVLKEVGCRGVGVDLSKKALENARKNAENLNIKAEFILGDFALTYGQFEVVVVNPPYVIEQKIDRSCLFDPPISLFPKIQNKNKFSIDHSVEIDNQGCVLGVYNQLLATKNLSEKGRLILEIPESAVEKTIKEGQKNNLELELVKEIGNQLYMLVMSNAA